MTPQTSNKDLTVLPTSRKFIKDALTAMYARQTADEQIGGFTSHLNDIGFNAADAPFASSLAEHIRVGRSLSAKQLTAAHKMLQKYQKQLSNYLNFDFDKYPNDPRPHTDTSEGVLAIRDGKLLFFPRIYPSTKIKSHGFAWDQTGEHWTCEEPTVYRIRAIEKLFKDVTLDASVRDWMKAQAATNTKLTARAFDPGKPTKVTRRIGKDSTNKEPWMAKPGWVDLIDESLWFFPMVYPTTQLKETTWFYRKAPSHMAKAWQSNLGMESITWLQEFFPDVHLTPAVEDWMQEFGAVGVIPATNEIISSNGFNLKSYQAEAASHAVKAQRALISLAPGLGKTPTAVTACRLGGARVILVVAVKSLLRNWEREIKRWDDKAVVQIWHGEHGWPPHMAQSATHRFYIVTNFESLVRWREEILSKKKPMADFIKGYDIDTLIVDESSLIKNWRKPKKNRKTGKTEITVQRGQAVIEAADAVERFWQLSGGPAPKKLDDMWAQLFAIDPDRFGSYWRFAQRYCVVVKDQWGWKIEANKAQGPEMIKRDYADIFFARTHDQVEDLPGWQFETIEVDMEKDQEEFYADLETRMMAEISSMDDSALISVSNSLAKITRLIQAASNPFLVEVERDEQVMRGPNSSGKWEAVKELLDTEMQAPGIIWVNFIATGEMIGKYLREGTGLRVEMLTGATKEEDRQRFVDDFQEGKIDWLVAHPGVGRYGHTLTAAKTMIWLERNYDGENYFQGLHRAGKRIGATHSCRVVHLLSTYRNGVPTIDHVIDGILDSRTETTHRLTAGDLKKVLRAGEYSDEN